jgi:hypothetical protein
VSEPPRGFEVLVIPIGAKSLIAFTSVTGTQFRSAFLSQLKTHLVVLL